MIAALIAILLLTLCPVPVLCQPDKIWEQDVAHQMDVFMKLHQEKLAPPVVGDIQMPARLWWMAQVAAKVTGCDLGLLVAVMRFECDFRTGAPCGRVGYLPPMGIHPDFRRKYPVDDDFGNVLTAARRLGQFKAPMEALKGYNKDRSSKFWPYCRSVLAAAKEVRDYAGAPADTWAWRSAVELGKKGLEQICLAP